MDEASDTGGQRPCAAPADERATAETKPKRRRVRADGWTDVKRTGFLDHLAATSNVRGAAAAVGMAATSVYALRRRDAGFAVGWDAALDEAYVHIEAQLLERALGQVADPRRGGDSVARPFDPEMALRILGQRKRRAISGSPHGTMARIPLEAVIAVLKRKLDALAKQSGEA